MTDVIDQDVEIRGAPWELLQKLYTYTGEKRVFEILIDGPRGTGKSKGVCYVLRYLVDAHPGIRILVVRATRKSMTDSWLKTFNDVLPEDDEARAGPSPEQRSRFAWPNGSVIVIGGLDDPVKLYSTDWDVVVLEEATQPGISEDDWQQFRGALRQFTTPWQLLLALCNPHSPRHWIMRRVKSGKCERLRSLHEHNPKWHNGDDWTEEGRAYIGSLQQLTGTQRARNYQGEWVAAEGAVYSCWDEDKHVVNAPPDMPTWYAAGVDWGYSDAGVLLVAGIDNRNRVTITREIYRTGETLDWWVARALELSKAHEIKFFACDPARPDAIESFNRALRDRGLSSIARAADNTKSTTPKGDLAGIDLVRHYLERERLYVLEDKQRLVFPPDPVLLQRKLATSLTDEFPEYVYRPPKLNEIDDGRLTDRTDERCDDHALDALRYLISSVHQRDLSEPVKYELPNGAPRYDLDDMELVKVRMETIRN